MESLVTLIQLNRSIGLKPGEINSGDRGHSSI